MLEHYTADVLTRLTKGWRSKQLAVAVSGGADSMALTLLAHQWAKKNGFDLTCLTVNHGLRKAATKEALQVAKWCKKQGIAHQTLRYEGEKPTANIMAEARSIRYQLLFGWCREHKAGLLVAHNLEDQAETFLLRLQRGTGASGLACMPESAERFGIRVMRPLLAVKRQHLEAYLKQRKQPWLEDPTNADPQYARNSLRMALNSNLKTKDELTQRLFESARSMGRTRAVVDAEVNKALKTHVAEPLPSICRLDIKGYKTLHEEIALRVLSQLLAYAGQQDEMARFESLEPLHQAILSGTLSRPRTLSGCMVEPYQKNALFFYREPSRLPAATKLNKNEQYLWDNRFTFATKTHVTIRPLAAADIASAPTNMPKRALLSLPSVWKKNEKGLETLLFAPHIKRVKNTALKDGLSTSHTPRKKLEISAFAYCRATVYHVV